MFLQHFANQIAVLLNLRRSFLALIIDFVLLCLLIKIHLIIRIVRLVILFADSQWLIFAIVSTIWD